MRTKFTLFFILFFLSFSNLLWAVPAYPGWLTMDQPDGTTIEVRQMGDEFYHYWINRDEQEVIKNADGYWVVVPTQLTPKQRQTRRMESPMYRTASEIKKAASRPSRVLVILMNFSDVTMQTKHNHQFYVDMLNKDDSISVREYFKQSSDGHYAPQFDVYGPYTTDSVMAYYGGNNEKGNDLRVGCMIHEACVKAHNDGCNFANYDEDGDGKVDNINVIFAGYSESAGGSDDCIWPNQWNMRDCRNCGGEYYLDGKKLFTYSCSAELRGWSGTNSASIGTFCHEFSHILGMPDYYDTSYGYNNDNDMTPGKWSLMDNGNYNNNSQSPPLYSIFDKCYMGWASVPALLAKDAQVTITMPTGTAYARQITGTSSSKPYTSTDTIYYIENRQKSGFFDIGLPGKGMLIWRVLYRSNWDHPNNDSCVLRYTLVSASGSDKGLGTGNDSYPGTKGTTSKTLWPGCAFSQITQNSNGNITFNYNGGSTTYTHTWMAQGSQFTTTTSRSSLSLPSSSPSAWSGTEFVGWTKQKSMQQDGSNLVLAKAYDEINANTTFYAVYKSTSSPIRYFYQQNAPTYASVVDAQFVIVSGQSVEIGGQTVNTPGQYPYDTIKTIQGDSVQLVNLSWADLNKTIVYRGSNILAEVTGTTSTYGLHTDKFGQDIMEHYFSNGIGVVAFNNNLTTIGNYAFLGCRNNLGGKLLSVQIPNTVTYIGANAFSNCWELTSIDLPTCAGVKIDDNAFYKCQSMVDFVLPDGVDTIGDNVFQNCTKLKHVTLSEGLKLIGHNVFNGCTVLEEITSRSLKPAASYSTTFSGITPANIVLKVWPSKVATYSATTYWKAFTNIQPIACGTTATITPSTHTICPGDSYTWRSKQFTKAGVYRDTTYNKYGCDTTIYQLTLTHYPTYHFQEAAIFEAGQSYSWRGRTITEKGYYYDSLTTSSGCDSVYSFFLTDSAHVIFYTAPQKLLETNSNDGVGLHTNAFDKTIVVHTFSNGTGMIAFSDTLRTIGYRAFYGCQNGNNSAIYTITLPKTITSIGGQAFYANFQLTSITIPEFVTSMGQKALHNCTGLTSITCEALTPPTCGDAAFNLVPKTIPLYVWPKALKTYQATAQWSDFSNIQMIDCNHPLVTNLTADTICQGDSILWKGNYYKQTITKADTAMNKYGCDTVIDRLELTVGEKYEMKEYHFLPTGETYTWRGHDFTKDGIYHDSLHSLLGCDSVYTLYLMDSVKTVIYTASAQLPEVTGNNAGIHLAAFDKTLVTHTFADGTGILLFADTLRQVGEKAFYTVQNGVKITTAILPKTITTIGVSAFEYQNQMTSVNMPSGVTSIGARAFYKCQTVNGFALPAGLTKISDRMLYDCQKLTPVVIPQGVTMVEEYGLSKLYAVTELTFPAKVTSLGDNAMDNTTNLTQLTSLALVPPTVGGANTFLKVPKNIPLYVYPSAVQVYSTAYGWQDFTNIQTIACPDPAVDTTKATICEGNTYNWREKQYSAAGTYSDTLRNIYGCDSAVHRLVLNTNPTYLIPETATFVTGMTYIWRGQNLTATGIYYDSLQTTLGCDSVYQMTLTMTDSTRAIIYTAPAKLTEVTEEKKNGLKINAFGQEMLSHTFNNGSGVIAFANPVTQVGEYGFYGCNSATTVTSITLPNTITSIGGYAFYCCWDLTSLNIPAGVDTIGNAALARCEKLPVITLPEGITILKYRVMDLCKAITTLTIPSTVKELEKKAIGSCTSLTSITCEALTPPTTYTESFEGLTKGNITLNVYPISESAYRAANNWKDFNIQTIPCPDPAVDTTKAAICNGEKYAWRDKEFTKTGTYSDTLVSIYGCDSAVHRLILTVNPTYLFEESVTFVKGMTYVWRGKDLTTTGIYYDSLATKLGCDSVYKMTLTMTDSTKAIIYTATQKLTETTDAKVIGLHTNAFGQDIITHHFSNGTGVIAFNNNLTTIGDKAFYGCREGNSGNKLMTITIPNTVTNIGTDAFSNCWELSSANIPESVTSIGQSAFYKCYALNNITLPESLTTLGNSVFNNCTTLVAITSKALNPPTCGTTVFNNVPKTIPLYVWPKALNAYQTANQWSDFTNIHRICDDPAVTNFERDTICQGETYNWREKQYTTAGIYKDTTMDIHGCDTMIYQLDLVVNSKYLLEESDTIVDGMTYNWHGQTLTTAGVYNDNLTSQYGCDSIYRLTLVVVDSVKAIVYAAPNKLTEATGSNRGVHLSAIGSNVKHYFRNGRGIIVSSDTIKAIGEYAFYGCRDNDGGVTGVVTSIKLPKCVTSIGEYAFYCCWNLTSLNIPSGVTTIGQAAFARCQVLTSLVLPEGITQLEYHVLYRCEALTSLTIPASVDTIGKEALMTCNHLQSLTVNAIQPPKCSMLDNGCFSGITKTIPVYVKPSSMSAYQASTPWQYFTNFQANIKKLTLSELDMNTSKIVADTYDSIYLVRTLYSDRYNTFCVPFDIERDTLDKYFDNVKLYEMTSASSNNGITINFDETAEGEGITAGVPYLMEVTENVVNPVFTNRTITAVTPDSVTKGSVTYKGVYCQTLLHRNSSPMEYFLASNNLLYRPVADENMKGLRCYFKINNESGAPIRMTVNQPDIPTELVNVNANVNANGKMVLDNQLIIFRDGKMYNAQGQLMKH